ncbi:MAG: hypothetical protein H7281_16065 [Bacteriovorax sp.]|nr:hypothetical protein [Bacteriovorax sp.]
MKSIVHDGDLNIINNIDPNLGWITSVKYNFPDMHDHGSSLLWAPLFAIASLFNKLIGLSPIVLQGSSNPVHYDMVVIFIMNVFFGLIGLKIIRHIVTRVFSITPPLWSIFLVVFTTGFFNFLMYQFSSADITLFFYATLVTYYMSFINEEWSRLDFLLLGCLFAFGSVIKLTFPLLIPIYFFFYFTNIKFSFFDFIKRNLFFIFGLVVIYFLNETNNMLKFGFVNLDQGYSYSYNLNNLFSPIPHFRPFFGPAGLFIVSPISLFATLALFFLFFLLINRKFKMEKDIYFFLVVGISFIAKHCLNLTAIFDGYAGFGSRQYMIDTIVIYMLIVVIYKNRFDYKKFYKFSIAVFILCMVWTCVENLWWLSVTTLPKASFNAYYIQDYLVLLNQLSKMLVNLFLLLKNLPFHYVKNINYMFLLIIPVWVWTKFKSFLFHREVEKVKLTFQYTGTIIVLFYTYVTFSNLYFNPRNVAIMKKQNYFSKKVVGNGKEIFLYDEYTSSIVYAMEIAKLNKNREWFDYQKSVLGKLLERTKKQIVFDPIDFKSQLDFGKLKTLEVDFHNDDFNEVLDYNSPVTFKVWK